MTKKSPPSTAYNCAKCPGYCCTYPRICVTKRDVRRLAKYFGLTNEAAARRFTKAGYEKNEMILRRQEDDHFGFACHFLDPASRNCTIYEARPSICREFPGARRCGYYDFLSFERRTQEDPSYISTTDSYE